ncbi:hypothetical protein KI387_027974 [Taxus chinensis]|uniref:Uncharacterized protein n=1 Tax=Taxus chinensis TaxID=29808 RepID=A0AA38FYY0_TAXCH|nr:hypothetical protein KI387_027974 [Taxus chinensis]
MVANGSTVEVIIQANKRDLTEISTDLRRVPRRMISAQSNPKGPIEICSGLGAVPRRSISAWSNRTGPIGIYLGLGRILTRAISAQPDLKVPTENYSGLGEVRIRSISARLNQKGITEFNCILGRNSFYQNCLWASKRSFFRTVTLGPSIFYQARAISIVPQKTFAIASNLPPEYQMPTVTWGVVQGDKEKLASRALIFTYLRSLGIVPDELEDLELPSTVDIMKERVEFLQGMGLSIKDINEYPLMLGCSVRKNLIPVLEFFYRFGLEKSDLPILLGRYPQVLHASVCCGACSHYQVFKRARH